MEIFGADTNSRMIWKVSDWFGMNFNPNESGQAESIRTFNPNESGQAESIRTFNPNESGQSESIRTFNPMIPAYPNDSEKFCFIRNDRIDSD